MEKNSPRKVLKIGKSYIEHAGNKVRLCAPINIPDVGEMVIFYEVNEKWGAYFVDELSDPFVLAVFKRALKNGWDISFETPMSEDLYYQLSAYGIPVLSYHVDFYQPIKLMGKVIACKISSENKVGTGFSAGVDSFYSVLKHKGSGLEKYNVTHLVLARNGAAVSSEPEKKAREWFDTSNKKLANYAKQLGMSYISIWSNVTDFYWKDQCGYGDTIVTSGFIHALRKLFGIYYWASAYRADVLDFKGFSKLQDGGYIEPFTVPLVSVDGLKFYLSGGEVSRIEKVAYIADFKEAQKGLTVCGDESAKNCGKCVKCLRTMAELNAIGKLDDFRESFPVDEYRKRQIGSLAYELALDHPPFTTDIIHAMKSNGKQISPFVYPCKWLVCKPIIKLRAMFSNVYWTRRLYYRFHLDEKFDTKHSEKRKKERLEACKAKKT